jgi:hypothetical protein
MPLVGPGAVARLSINFAALTVARRAWLPPVAMAVGMSRPRNGWATLAESAL